MVRCYVFWIFVFNAIYLYNAGNVNCAHKQDPNCFRKTINCVPDGKDCIVTCSANRACKQSIINCAPLVGCSVYCLKYQSCQNIVINGGSAITLSVYTGNTAQSLMNSQINCQNVAYCDVTCMQKRYQCRNSQIKAENAAQLIVTCKGRNQNTHHCQGLDIYCPKTQPKCFIYSPIVLEQVNIYSQLGFDGVSICGSENSDSIGNMHCGSEYQISCSIHAFSANYCDMQSICDTANIFTGCNPPPPTTLYPTLSPTKITTIPTTIPSSHPTFEPSFIPSSIPTLLPIGLPTNEATSIPTSKPTFNPTLIPSSIPVIIRSVPLHVEQRPPTMNPTNNLILTSYPTKPSFEDIRIVTKTVMVLAKNTRTVSSSVVGFIVMISLLSLICCVVLCIIIGAMVYIKMRQYEQHVVSNNDNVHGTELQQLTIPTNINSNKENVQSIAKTNDDDDDDDDEEENCNEIYEGKNTTQTKSETYLQIQTYQSETAQTDKQDLSVLLSSTLSQDENIVGDLSDDDNLDLYGPGSGNYKTLGN